MLLYDKDLGYFILDGDKKLGLYWGPNYLHINDDRTIPKWEKADEQIIHSLIRILFEEKLKDHRRNEPNEAR